MLRIGRHSDGIAQIRADRFESAARALAKNQLPLFPRAL